MCTFFSQAQVDVSESVRNCLWKRCLEFFVEFSHYRSIILNIDKVNGFTLKKEGFLVLAMPLYAKENFSFNWFLVYLFMCRNHPNYLGLPIYSLSHTSGLLRLGSRSWLFFGFMHVMFNFLPGSQSLLVFFFLRQQFPISEPVMWVLLCCLYYPAHCHYLFYLFPAFLPPVKQLDFFLIIHFP